MIEDCSSAFETSAGLKFFAALVAFLNLLNSAIQSPPTWPVFSLVAILSVTGLDDIACD